MFVLSPLDLKSIIEFKYENPTPAGDSNKIIFVTSLKVKYGGQKYVIKHRIMQLTLDKED